MQKTSPAPLFTLYTVFTYTIFALYRTKPATRRRFTKLLRIQF